MSTKTLRMKGDLLTLASALYYGGILFDIVRNENFVEIYTDSHNISFNNKGEILNCTKLNKHRSLGK